MKNLKTQIKEHLLKERDETRSYKRDSFYCTESETNQFELYHKIKGTPETNPMTVETQFALGMRKKLEEAVIGILDKMDVLMKPEPFKNRDGKMIEEPDQHRVEMEKEGIKIIGYMDGIILEEDKKVPIEIKTSYGFYQQKELKSGKVKETYLKQLCMYMDSIGSEKGYLFQVHFEKDLIIDDIYQFVVIHQGNGIYKCGYQTIDLNEVYKRFKMIWDNYIIKDIEPESEFVYKYELEKINWNELPKSKIQNARNNKAVVGSWKVKYSPYKNLIIEKEAKSKGKLFTDYIGYNQEELKYITEKTNGYTNWGK